MSNVPITDSSSAVRKVDTFARTEGADTVEVQAIALINPLTGDAAKPAGDGSIPVTLPGATVAALTPKADAATDAGRTAIAGAAGTGAPALATGASGILGWLRKLVDVVSGTLNIGGTVALDAPTLAALEDINATTGGLTNAQLRAAAVPVDGPLTDAQLRTAPVPVNVSGVATAAGQAAIVSALGTPLQAGGAVALDAGTLAALETVNVGNLPADPPTETTLQALLAKVIAGPATEATLASLLARLPAALGPQSGAGSTPVALSNEDADTLTQIVERLGVLQLARNADGSLRVTLQGGTVATVTTVGTVTTVTTVTTVATLSNQTSMGGYSAAPQIPALMNLAAASNIDRMAG